ncbi:histidine kinase dimerization/phospho-acceptor domain-containing protein [Sulfurospirillum cavolei]|uniref:histidine kinase dimerization/phospho-acceptor domain-containing protein n=1 Tax=Sulfurospirillum cavolei TaxID=366522 RepID=UPI0018CDD5BD|nr:histidine kinase dimerization/phospho-acceptor domain-containing protein [Sulfurospirillum cavolei]
MQIKVKLLLWYLLIQSLILAGFNYALYINVEHNLRENISGVIQTHEAIEHFLNTVWLLSPFCIVLSSFGGYFLIGRYFKPLQAMLHNMQTINAKELSGRIETHDNDDEISRLATAFNAMLERLEGSFSAIKAFNTQASHELRTPLTIMRGEIEIALRKERSDEEYRRILEVQLEEIQALQTLIEDMLLFAEGNASLSYEYFPKKQLPFSILNTAFEK